MNKKRYSLIVIVGAFLAGGAMFVAISAAEANLFTDIINIFDSDGNAPAETQAPPYVSSVNYEAAIINAVKSASPSVISIVVSKDVSTLEQCSGDPFAGIPPEFRDFFGPFPFNGQCETGTIKQEIGGGSGFIATPEGLIVTNKHVVADLDADYTVFTNDGKKHAATVIARDPVQDIAIVKIAGSNFPTLPLADSDSVQLGQTAIAIGNALGEFRNTVSTGIVSGLARAIEASGTGFTERLEGLIQTDAAINPGNSGGPLLNLRGEVIGINTAVARGAENIGFAIPVDRIKKDIESVRATGKITVAFLGVRYIPLTEDLAEEENLPVANGVLLRGSEGGQAVVSGSPAAKAGLMAGDIIIEVGGKPVNQENSLAALIQNYNVGETVALKILRDGKEMTLSATLAELKP
ncbi:MAG: trypsin-like peptidase domain-containing protein [Patescibacteria group bacterium]